MTAAESAFFDTNVPLYLLSADLRKAGKAEDLLAAGGVIRVQVLNELVAVARRQHAAPGTAIEQSLAALRQVCRVQPLSVSTHDQALAPARRFGIPIYDATLAASALAANCRTLFSEDFQHGQRLEQLTVANPFR